HRPMPNSRETWTVVRHKFSDVAILTIDPALPGQLRADGSPHCGHGTLRQALETARGSFQDTILPTDASGLHLVVRQIAAEAGTKASRMDRKRADSMPLAATIKLNAEQRVGGLRLPVARGLIVGARQIVRVVQINPRIAMADRRKGRDSCPL